MNCIVLIFSKDRALQLDATLRSFFLHCQDAASSEVRILFTTTNPLYAEQYRQLEKEYQRYTFLQFVREKDFRSDVIALLAPFEQVLFLTDDNIFVQDFRLSEVIESLQKHTDALGFSIRLGRNTTYCYPLSKAQQVPDLKSIGTGIFKYNWTNAEYDFGYPLEVSSSLYRVEDILPFIAQLTFRNPNTLEALMAERSTAFRNEMPYLLCFEQSATFCAPINMVQTMWTNRASSKVEYSPDSLAKLFDDGLRIDISAYNNFIPNACHQEVELKLVEPAKTDKKQPPLVSVIIPCYNQACYLPEVVESVVSQTYHDWECIIVNDGSSDNTSEVAKQLAAKFPNCRIRLLEKTNGGLPDARNAGIHEARGEWILPLDSDDMFAADFLERAVSIIQSNPSVNLVTTNYQAFGAKSNEWIPNNYSPERILYENTFIYASLYKKELWETVGGYYTGIPWGAEDWNFWIACSKIGIKPARIHGKLFLYRTHAGISMYDRMMEHWNEVKAIIRTLHPDLYPNEILLSDHQVISSMHIDTAAKLDNILSKFPDLSMPYFWRGLHREKGGDIIDAINDFKKSVELSEQKEWQPLLHLGLLEKASGNNDEAEYCFREVVRLLSGDPNSKHIVQQICQFIPEKKLNILFYYAGLHNSDKPFAGTSRATVTLASALVKSGNFNSVCVTGDFIIREELVDGIKFLPLPLPVPEQRQQFLEAFDIVVFATHLRYFADLSKPKGQVWILHQHCWAVEPPEMSRIDDFDVVLSLSDIHKTAIQQQGIPEECIEILPNLIDTTQFYPRNVERKPHSIMFAGAIVPHKGVHILIEAFNLVKSQLPDAELHIYGSASMWRDSNTYENNLENLNLPGVFFHGTVLNNEMPSIYSQHSLLCLPSEIESFSLVSIEAQACGCVPIAHNSGGISATLLNNHTGFLYFPNTPQKLTETIVKAFNIIDIDESIRQHAMIFVRENFEITHLLRYFSKIIEQITESKEQKYVTTSHPRKLLTTVIQNHEKLRVMLVYSLHPVTPKITFPEWIKEALREYYKDEVEVFACGPQNEIPVPDSPDFYEQVADIAHDLNIDAIWDIEGGASSIDFMFKRFPSNISLPKIWWAIDTHQFLPLMVDKAKYFDIVFSAQKNAVSSLGPHAIWLPAGASLHEIDYHLERTIDVGFIGNINPHVHHRRKKIIERLQEELSNFKYFNNVFLHEKAELTSQMKIIVNVSLHNDINFRVFETLACGAMLITDKIYNNGLEELFEDGKHLVTFKNEEELIKKINYYLKNDDERVRIAKAGQERVLQKFTHRVLLKEPLELIAKLVDGHRRSVQVSIGKTLKCWCNGQLKESVHPLYGQCQECGTLVLKEQLTEDKLKEFYSLDGYWHEHQVNVSKYPPIEQRAINDFADRIPVWYQLLRRYKPVLENLLEIGCAHGGFLYYCHEHGVKNVVGVEVDEKTCNFARKHFNLQYVVSGLFPDVFLPFQKFDAVTGFDVIEHFPDPIAAMQSIARILKDDGICLFQIPCYRGEGREWAQFRPTEHIYLYNSQSIRQLFDCAGIEITEILPGYFTDDMFVIARKKRPSSNILWIRTDSIGDNILASSMLLHIRERYKDAKITILCQDHIAELYEVCPFIDEIITFNKIRAYQDEKYRNEILCKLQSQTFNISLNSVYSREPLTDLLAIASNTKEKIGMYGNLSNMPADVRDNNNKYYTRLLPSEGEHKAELERHVDFLKGIGIEVSHLEPVVWLTHDDFTFADSFLKENNLEPDKTIALFAGAQVNVRIYEHYGSALSQLCKDNSFSVIALGASHEYEINKQNLNQIAVKTINLSGKTTVRQSAALLSKCRLAVGAETGLAHISCAVGTPNVVLLGGGHFGRFMPYSPLTSVVCLPLECFDCDWRCKYQRVHCVRDISPDVIEEAIRHTLNKPSEKPRVFVQGKSLWSPDVNYPQWRWFSRYLDIKSVDIIPIGEVPEISEKVQEQNINARVIEEIDKINKLLESRRFEEANAALNQAIERYPDTPDLFNLQAMVKLQTGNREEAKEILLDLINRWPGNVFALNTLGILSWESGETEKALEYFFRALQIAPYEKIIVMNAGTALTRCNMKEEAKKLYSSYLQMNPNDIEIGQLLSMLYK